MAELLVIKEGVDFLKKKAPVKSPRLLPKLAYLK